MFIELHIIQNFAPSCLNRDDTNAPKDCDFGGFRRSRISSQCIKRSIRAEFIKNTCADIELGKRTKRVTGEIAKCLEESGKDKDLAGKAADAFVSNVMSKMESADKTSVLLFIGEDEIRKAAQAILNHWEAINTALMEEVPATDLAEAPKKAKKGKKATGGAIEIAIAAAAKDFKPGTRAIDVALFGRMMAGHEDMNIDAACQMAHAISTHKVNMEMDFYTAVDDLNSAEDSGAGMMGYVEFNSSCFYRYSLVDIRQLTNNLDGDVSLVRKTVDVFLRASIAAIPTGKQNSMAAQNPPSFVFAVARDSGSPWSLANAFEKPVRSSGSNGETGFVKPSTEALVAHWKKLSTAYGENGVKAGAAFALDDADFDSLKDKRVENFDALVQTIMSALPEA